MVFTIKDQLIDHLDNLHNTFERNLSKDPKYINSMIYDYIVKSQDNYKQYNYLLLDNPKGNFFDYEVVTVGKVVQTKQKRMNRFTSDLVKKLEIAIILEDFVSDNIDLDHYVGVFYSNKVFGINMINNYFSNKKDKDTLPLPKLFIKQFIKD